MRLSKWSSSRVALVVEGCQPSRFFSVFGIKFLGGSNYELGSLLHFHLNLPPWRPRCSAAIPFLHPLSYSCWFSWWHSVLLAVRQLPIWLKRRRRRNKLRIWGEGIVENDRVAESESKLNWKSAFICVQRGFLKICSNYFFEKVMVQFDTWVGRDIMFWSKFWHAWRENNVVSNFSFNGSNLSIMMMDMCQFQFLHVLRVWDIHLLYSIMPNEIALLFDSNLFCESSSYCLVGHTRKTKQSHSMLYS